MVSAISPFGCKADKRMRALAWMSGITLVTILFSLSFAFLWLSIDPYIEARDIYLSCIFIPLIVAPLSTMIGIRKQHLVQALAEENIKLANVDTLTGLPNRRAFMREAGELQTDLAEGQVFACLIGDIDDFKQVNDQYGHLVGDDALSFIAQQLAALETDRGVVARLGGEEFAIAGIFTSPDAAASYGETLVRSIERQTFVGHGHRLSITISMGLTCDRGGEGLSMLLSRADKALYQAKQNGKNCLAQAA